MPKHFPRYVKGTTIGDATRRHDDRPPLPLCCTCPAIIRRRRNTAPYGSPDAGLHARACALRKERLA